MAYYTLISRETVESAWGVEFGDYDRETVEFERETMRDAGKPAKHLRIIRTRTARQSEIDRALEAINYIPPLSAWGAAQERGHCL